MTPQTGSRRQLLAGIATAGAAAIGGCSGLSSTGEKTERDAPASLPSDVVDSFDWPPSPFPVAVPEALAGAHETRARNLLAEVPAEPDLPNQAVADAISDDRDRAHQRAARDVPDHWPVDTLSAWRRRRADAAAVRGAYRAAIGDADASDLVARRRAVRDERGTLASDLEYRAGSPEEAVLAYEPIESLLAECEKHVRPRVTYPADPVAEPFRAAEAVGNVERAQAAVADADGLRRAVRGERDEASPQWASVIAAAAELRPSVSRTRATVGNEGEPRFGDEDLSGTVAQELVAVTDRRVESTVDDVRQASDAGEYATAVVEAGAALAAVEGTRTVSRAIRDGRHREEPSKSSVRSAAERAQRSVREALDGGDPLATRLVRPGLETLGFVAGRTEDGYGSVRRIQAELRFVDLYASAVPAATEFVRGRLE